MYGFHLFFKQIQQMEIKILVEVFILSYLAPRMANSVPGLTFPVTEK